MDFDFSNIPDDPTKLQEGSGERPSPGRGMVRVTKWSEYAGAQGKAHELEYEIVAWSNPADVAKTHKESFFYKDNTGKGFPMKRFTLLAMAAGLYNTNDVKRWKAQGIQPQVNMDQLVGRPLMIQLVEDTDKNDATKKYINIGNIGLAIYHIKDPRVKGWPVDPKTFNESAALVGDWITGDKPVQHTQPVGSPFGNV